MGATHLTHQDLAPRDGGSPGRWFRRCARAAAPDRTPTTSTSTSHLPAEQIETELPDITGFACTCLGVDPITELVPVFPTAHYAMGGSRPTSRPRSCATTTRSSPACTPPASVPASACTGQPAGHQLAAGHQCLRPAGGIAAAEYAVSAELPDLPDDSETFVASMVADLRESTGGERVGEIRKGHAGDHGHECSGLSDRSDAEAGAVRRAGVAAALPQRGHPRQGERYNTELLEAIELGFLLDLAEVLVVGAIGRKSPGRSRREDYQTRDDVNFMRHTMAYRHVGEDGQPTVRLDYKPVW